MPISMEMAALVEPDFKWVKKIDVSCLEKIDVKLYESFTYDGVDYTLYDCVYMYKQGEPEPYIGKLIEIWENVEKSKKVKVQWFLRPSEISFYLRDAEVMDNELFLAGGDGVGVANINPLEAVAGKCKVLCISMDKRNRQPSDEELQMADYVFYRIFDVKSCQILNHLDDRVGGLPVKFVFNQNECEKILFTPTLDYKGKDDARKVIAREETPKTFSEKQPEEFETVKLDGKLKEVIGREITHEKMIPAKKARNSANLGGPSSKKEKLDHLVNFPKDKDGIRNSTISIGEKESQVTNVNSLCVKPALLHDKNVVEPIKLGEVTDSLNLGERSTKTNVLPSETNSTRDGSSGKSILWSKEKREHGHNRGCESNSVGPRKLVQFIEDLCGSEEKLRKKPRVDDSFKYLEDKNESNVDSLKDKSSKAEKKLTSINSNEDNAKSKIADNSCWWYKGAFMENKRKTTHLVCDGNMCKSLVASKSLKERSQKKETTKT